MNRPALAAGANPSALTPQSAYGGPLPADLKNGLLHMLLEHPAIDVRAIGHLQDLHPGRSPQP